MAELIRTAWRFGPCGRNRVARSEYPSTAGRVMSSMKTSSVAAPATAISLVLSRFPADVNYAFAARACAPGHQIQLAVRERPVYNPACRTLLTGCGFFLRSNVMSEGWTPDS